MDSTLRLQPGTQILCPLCRKWHAVTSIHTEGTDYTVRMLYFVCRGLRYYAGQGGLTSRHRVKGDE